MNPLAANSLALIGRVSEAFPKIPCQLGHRDHIANADAEAHIQLQEAFEAYYELNVDGMKESEDSGLSSAEVAVLCLSKWGKWGSHMTYLFRSLNLDYQLS
jgi:hypothetical protein